jgi:murein DD-endopeptidase MepM/ murein hydrolase activator NlpD
MSCLLMGVAMTVALEGVSAAVVEGGPSDTRQGRMVASERKSDRLFETIIAPGSSDRTMISVPTLVQDGERAVARTVDLARVRMPLGLAYTVDRDYPAFDPVKMLVPRDDDGGEAVDPTRFYGANIETDVALRTIPFSEVDPASFDTVEMGDGEIESIVRGQSAGMTAGDIQIAAMHVMDATRFGGVEGDAALQAANVRITTENVSQAAADIAAPAHFNEMLIDIDSDKRLGRALADAGLKGRSAENIVEAMATLMNGDALREGQKLRVSAYMDEDGADIRRLSIYDGVNHRVTVALDDRDQYVPAIEPEEIMMTTAQDGAAPIGAKPPSGTLPAAYDAIYRAAFAYGLTDAMAKRLVQMLAADVEMREKIGANDSLEVLFTKPSPDMTATEDSAILMAAIRHRGEERRLYRFEDRDGAVDYYDAEGASTQQGMLRNPVPAGVFKSGFGMRRHPILGYKRMHTGADWSAPRGTPIIAVGSGVVEKAGWAGGYGRQTQIRHANGFISSYSHQNTIAKGVVPGARVRQGQVIGTVGSTGLSTGPHLHYEIIVNGNKVDPMRVRLPGGKQLKGRDLEQFQTVRREIDRLLEVEMGRNVAALQ